jgi:hypothetical protein
VKKIGRQPRRCAGHELRGVGNVRKFSSSLLHCQKSIGEKSCQKKEKSSFPNKIEVKNDIMVGKEKVSEKLKNATS